MSHTNTELKNIIKEHFAKQGQRLKNMSKCVNFQLLEIVEKYNIPLPEPVKKERKKIEKKETLDTTNHPFKLGTFNYTYECDDEQGYYGKSVATIKYTITKITKCFVFVEYSEWGETTNTKKYKIDYIDYIGWFFTVGELHCKKRIPFNKSINEEHITANWIIKNVWNRYH